jgi:SAM-dependent methyltransferase
VNRGDAIVTENTTDAIKKGSGLWDGDSGPEQQADAYHLPFDDAHFDAAHAEHVFEHLEDPDAVLREMRRVVKPGGWIVVGDRIFSGMISISTRRVRTGISPRTTRSSWLPEECHGADHRPPRHSADRRGNRYR